MLDFFEARAEGRLHPVLYRAVLGCFALARLWEGGALRGPQRGRSFLGDFLGEVLSLHMQDHVRCCALRLGEKRVADRIWREIPILVAPLQERVRRLPACINGTEEMVTAARIEWALDQLQDGDGARWWRDLDTHDPFWLEQVYTDIMGHQRGSDIAA